MPAGRVRDPAQLRRVGGVLSDHGLGAIRTVKDWPDALMMDADATGIAVLGVEKGFEAPDFVVVSEQDVLGDLPEHG